MTWARQDFRRSFSCNSGLIFIVMYLKTPLRRNSMVGKHPALFSGAHISIIFDKTGPTDDSNFIHEESKSKIKIYNF